MIFLVSSIFFTGLLVVALNKSYFLISLLALEFCCLGLFFISGVVNMSINCEYYINFYLLCLAVCEGTMGISILVLMSHSSGNNNISMKHFSLC